MHLALLRGTKLERIRSSVYLLEAAICERRQPEPVVPSPMSEIARFPLRVPAKKALGVLKALSNESRIRIMRLLAERPLGVSEIARQIGVSQPTATVYIQQLEEAGLISYRQVKTPQGVQKLSYTLYDSVEIDWGGEEEATVVEEFDVNVPVGHYTMIECSGRSLMANKARVIASTEDVSRFYHPIRMEAELLVLEEGRVRYLFPYNVPADHEAQSLRLSMEVSVAFPGPGRASRLDLRINGKELGLVTIDSAPSLAPAAPMPEWLPRELASSGRLLQVEIGRTETLLNSQPLAPLCIQDLGLTPMKPLEVVLSVTGDGSRSAGLIIFGKAFGMYKQDFRATISYRETIEDEKDMAGS
jgi:predicted transcriptional regulator